MKVALLLLFGFALSMNVQAQLILNEFMAVNVSELADDRGGYDDWIEIYNGGDTAVNLSGFYLTDDLGRLDKFQIKPQLKRPIVVPPSGYFIIWCDEDALEGPSHANFRLSAKGEFIALVSSEKEIVDSISFGVQMRNASFGRIVDGVGEWGFTTIPTPGKGNSMKVLHSSASSVPWSRDHCGSLK